MKTKLSSVLVVVLMFIASNAFGEDTVTLNGKLETVLCAMVCGTCCTGTSLTEKNNGFETAVKESDVDLTSFLDDGQSHGVMGYFEPGVGACETGECVYFHVTRIGASMEASFNEDTGLINIPNLDVGGAINYEVVLGPPYNLVRASPVGAGVIVQQGGYCSAAGAVCDKDTTCVEYLGIGGAAGPTFKTCEIPCESDRDCPGGQSCTLIADGPGYVCQ